MVPATAQKQGFTLIPDLQLHYQNRYKTVAAIGMPNTKDLHLQEEITLAACSEYHKKKGCMLIVGHSLLIGIKAPLCHPDRES